MQVWEQKYTKLEQLGQGSSGLIFKVLNKQTHQTLAAKIIKSTSDPADLQSIELEVKIMSSCLHNNIVKCIGVQVFSEEVWILMEYCSGGSLADMMRSRRCTFQEDQISDILKQVLEGLKCLHRRKIVHRDIKASNLLVDNGVVKIGDFGVSLQNQRNTSQSKFSRIGSPFWMSPEILSQSTYSDKGDIWALGITAIQLAQGHPPYSHQHPFRAIYSIQTHPPKGLQSSQKWSKQFNSFVNCCLTVDVKNRPSVEDLLAHCFISKKMTFSAQESSLECQIEQMPSEDQNTIIMHEQVPRSVWEKGSHPQTENKLLQQTPQHQNDDTVVINQQATQNIFLFSELKKSLEQSSMLISKKEVNDKENMISNEQISMSVEEKGKKVKQLYRMMEQEINCVRKRYMSQIRNIYLPEGEKKNKQWESPVKKLKDKNKTGRSNDSYLLSSQVFKKML